MRGWQYGYMILLTNEWLAVWLNDFIDQSEASILITNSMNDIQLSQSGLMKYLIKIEILRNTT